MAVHRFVVWDTEERPGRWLVIPFAVHRFKLHGPWREPDDITVDYHAVRYNDLGTRVGTEACSLARGDSLGQRVGLVFLPDPVATALREDFT